MSFMIVGLVFMIGHCVSLFTKKPLSSHYLIVSGLFFIAGAIQTSGGI